MFPPNIALILKVAYIFGEEKNIGLSLLEISINIKEKVKVYQKRCPDLKIPPKTADQIICFPNTDFFLFIVLYFRFQPTHGVLVY